MMRHSLRSNAGNDGRRGTLENFTNWAGRVSEQSFIAGRRCFVSNLNWRTSWQDLKDKFRESGEVVYANVVKDEDGTLQLKPDLAFRA